MDGVFSDHGLPGGVLLVKNPHFDSRNEEMVRVIAKEAFANAGRSAPNIVGCQIGRDSSIVELSNAQGIKSLVGSSHTIEAVFQEVVTLKISGDRLPPHTSVHKVCSSISPDLQLSFDGVSLSLSGCWSHVTQARGMIQSLIMDSQPIIPTGAMDNTRKELIAPAAPPTSSGFEPQPKSCYDSIRASPHVIKMMKRAGFGPGISHTEGTSTIHFRFDSVHDLDIAVDTFLSQSRELEDKLEVGHLDIPHWIHKDTDFGLMVSEIEAKYKDTIVTWLDGELKVEIVSAQLTEARAHLENMMELKQDKTKTREPSVKGDDFAMTNNTSTWKWLKPFENMLSFGPKVEYRQEIKLRFPKGRMLTLRHGNILDEHADALVNPANKYLSHGAGLAKQIDKASYGEVSSYSKNRLDKMGGFIPTGSVVTTGAGRKGSLLCHYIIHAVGPSVHEHSNDECTRLLMKTVEEILKEGHRLNSRSIAIPAISSGIFGVDKGTVAQIIMNSLFEYQQVQPDHEFLKDIRVVIWDRETHEPFLVIALEIEKLLKLH